MAQPLEAVQSLLLDLLSPRHVVTAERLACLDQADWVRVTTMLRQHRLGPMLHWRLTHEQTVAMVPDSLRQYAANSFKKSSLRFLRLQEELLRCQKTLADVGIRCVALKGAYLAAHVYPHSGMRTMRDLDVLVPIEQGLAAFQALLAAGYTRTANHSGDPAACMATEKHLPGLMSPNGRVHLELHVRLYAAECLPSHTSEHMAVWRRIITKSVAGLSIAYLSPTDLLLHLVIHAVYEHRFNNGPLVIADVAYLAAAGGIDWPLFWRLAEQWGASRGVALLLRATERYYGDVGFDTQATPTSMAEPVEDCCQLMLADARLARMLPIVARLAGKSPKQKLTMLWQELMPSVSRVQAEDEQAKYWFHRVWAYCKRPFSGDRMAEIRRSRQDPDFRQSVKRYAEVDTWLNGGAHSTER